MIVQPMPIAAIAASRGSGEANLLTRDPKEVWADAAAGSAATLTVDLGAARQVDTIFLGYCRPPAAGAIWSITGGVAAPNELTLQAAAALRVPDVAGSFPEMSHALWTGAAQTVRYLAIAVTQPGGSPALTAGVLVVGQAFVAELGQEWGFGRRPVDTGTATSLPSGGWAVIDGARKVHVNWTFGDLSIEEADRLEQFALGVGETAPGLMMEDADRTAGLRSRIHYGLFERWKQFERRNLKQTRWEVGIEQWI